MDARLVLDALPGLAARLRPDRFGEVAEAIMTTDTRPKTACADLRRARMAGMTKGSGMIQPNMATTLGFVMTDAIASPSDLRAALKRATARTFHRLSVDGDTSTNDTLSVMASGVSGFRPSVKALESALIEV